MTENVNMMNRLLILLLIPSLMLLVAGCSKGSFSDTDTPDTPSDVVRFSTDVTSRGALVTQESQLKDMGVYCAYTGSADWTSTASLSKMFNRKLVRNSSTSSWDYDGESVKWDASTAADRYTFFAYAPFASQDNGITVQGTSGTTGIPSIAYAVPTTTTRQPDLLVAHPRKNIRPTGNAVALSMEHALTCVGFQIAGNGEKVTGIKLAGISSSGTLVLGGGTNGAPVWSPSSSTSTNEYSAGINFDSGQSYRTATSTMSTDLIKTDGYLMMIPQTLGATAKLIVSCEGKNDVEFPLNATTWMMGKKVAYSITLKVRPELEISIEDWVTGYDTPVKTDPVTEPGIDIGDWGTGNSDNVDY